MAVPIRNRTYALHPVHAVLLAGTIPLFLGTLLCDLAYAASYEIQWKNFASWLLSAGLLFGGFALLWALIELFRADRRDSHSMVYVLVLLAAWLLGFIDVLIHSKDAWASMPAAPILSAIVAALAGGATWLGFSTLRAGAMK